MRKSKSGRQETATPVLTPRLDSWHKYLYSDEKIMVCSIPSIKTLRLPGMTLTLPMAKALKQSNSLHTLVIQDVEPFLTAEDMPQVKVIELDRWNNNLATALTNLGSLQEIILQTNSADTNSFVTFVRANKVPRAQMFAPTVGNRHTGLLIGSIAEDVLVKLQNREGLSKLDLSLCVGHHQSHC